MTANLHHRILAALTRRYEPRIMNNVCRSDYMECMAASVLGAIRTKVHEVPQDQP